MSMIYVVDVDDRIFNGDAEHDNRAELIYLHRDVIRGCTTSFHTMKTYYDFLKDFIGSYVTIQIHEYDVSNEDGFAESDELISDERVTSAALALYNNGKINDTDINVPWKRASTMPILYSFPLESPLENDGIFVCSSAMSDMFGELYISEAELDLLYSVASLFTVLNNYLYIMSTSEPLIAFRQNLLDTIPDLVLDFYNFGAPFHVDVIGLLKRWVLNFKFLD